MPIDFSIEVYKPAYDTFARTIRIFPVASQPGIPPYTARGIYDTRDIDVLAEDGSIVSDQKTILDIREAEFPVMPAQFDRVEIPAHGTIPAAGSFEIMDADSNGGGETTLSLRKMVVPRP